jgi:ankyrin repeat protein
MEVDRLRALFEKRVEKVEQEMEKSRFETANLRMENAKQRFESEKQRFETEKQRFETEMKTAEMERVRFEMEIKTAEMGRVRFEMEKKTAEMEKEVNSLRSIVARNGSDNTQLKLENTRLLTDLSKVHANLCILHPLPSARLSLQKCINHQKACNEAVNSYIELHTIEVIDSSPSLTLQLQELKRELTKAWDARSAAAFLCQPPPTLENILWIVAKSGFTKEVAPLMNLSKATRECKNLQRVMREVRNKNGETQLYCFCGHGMTSSVKRMLDMKSIDVEAGTRGKEDGHTCLINALYHRHLDICRLLIEKGAQLEVKGWNDFTPLHYAAASGHIEIVRLLCDRGADIEARSDDFGRRPLHFAVREGRISIVKELIEVRKADINARSIGGRTALRYAKNNQYLEIADFLVSKGGIVFDDENNDEYSDWG